MSQKNKPFRIGIIGGMGPMTDVLLQRLIIESTPAEKDQDHFQILCFSNPKIPDRTQSLEQDDGRRYVAAVQKTARALVGAGAHILAIPCNTAHARFEHIQKNLRVPIVNMIEETAAVIKRVHPQMKNIGVLATHGTLRTQLYEHALQAIGMQQRTLPMEQQAEVMGSIYRIKAGHLLESQQVIHRAIKHLHSQGAEAVILGCTELSLLTPELRAGSPVPLIDPLRIVAQKLVEIGLQSL